METIIVSLVSLVAGTSIGTFARIYERRHHATWLMRRTTAAEAYGAAVAVNSVIYSALVLARRVNAEARAGDVREVAESSDGNLTKVYEASKARIEKQREAKLNTRSIWGPDVAAIFDEYFDLASAWHNALGEFADSLHGHYDPDAGRWDIDVTGFTWQNVIDGTNPDMEVFAREVDALMASIRQFAHKAGVATIDRLGLPEPIRDVVDEHLARRERRAIDAARRMKALTAPK